MKILLVHGFLGQTQDWDQVLLALRQQNSEHSPREVSAIDLWRDVSPREFDSLESAGLRLSQMVTGDQLTLVGYSLGGRLLLHWPKDQWSRIKKVVLISTHTGLLSLAEKQLRQIADQDWAKRFLKDPWDVVLKDWNQQPVFKNDSVRPLRLETQFERTHLAEALNHWSLGRQQQMHRLWREAAMPVSYVTGELDSRFLDHATTLKTMGLPWSFQVLAKAGHSLHLSHPQEVADIVCNK